jgi:hypothetical protein
MLMKRLTLALGVLAFALMVTAPASVQADWLLIRWKDGDCKIWNDDGKGAKPWGKAGTDWKQLNKKKLKTWDAAWKELGKFQKAKKGPKCK